MAIAVMQGRLVPPEDGRFQCFPRTGWQSEFERAAEAGIDAIEWIYDAYGEQVNPIRDDTGLDELRRLHLSSGIIVRSLCARVPNGTNILRLIVAEAKAESARERLRAQGVLVPAAAKRPNGAAFTLQVNETWNRTNGVKLAELINRALTS